MRDEKEIRTELDRACEAGKHFKDLDCYTLSKVFGTQLALSWILNAKTMAPVACALEGAYGELPHRESMWHERWWLRIARWLVVRFVIGGHAYGLDEP